MYRYLDKSKVCASGSVAVDDNDVERDRVADPECIKQPHSHIYTARINVNLR